MKIALMLATIGVFHPGLALFVVWLVTMGFAVRLILEGRAGQQALLLPVRGEAAEPPRGG